jgi:hypothetical protein
MMALQNISGQALNLKGANFSALAGELRAALDGCVLDWNWRTDYEADLMAPVVTEAGDLGPHLIELDTPIPQFLIGYRLYLGDWPSEIEPLIIQKIASDGLEVQAKGRLSRSHQPPESWVVIGYPPPGPAAYEKLGLVELIWLINAIAGVIIPPDAQKKMIPSAGT